MAGGIDPYSHPTAGALLARSTAGAPTAGAWKTSQVIIDSNGVEWFCTLGGTPGTWIQAPPMVSPTSYTTPARVVGTVYQPNVNRPTLVCVNMAVNGGTGQVLVGTVTPPTGVIGELTQLAALADIFPVTFLVAPASYYEVTQVSGTVTIFNTHEWAL